MAARDDGSVGSNLVAVKQRLIAHPVGSTDLFSAFVSDAESATIGHIEGLGDTIEIASIELFGASGPSIPITIPLPSAVKQFGIGALQELFAEVRSYHAQTAEVRAWE